MAGTTLLVSSRRGASLKLISIVSPCYNEQDNVEQLYLRLRDTIARFPQFRYEHIFIDNSFD